MVAGKGVPAGQITPIKCQIGKKLSINIIYIRGM
jgi:hypothetical protein